MPPKPCYWTRKLELELVRFVRQRDYIWRPSGNTNHHIQQKYKAYAEFAAKLGRGFTARSVRDRWVNIRSTFNYNYRKVEKSKLKAKTPGDIYVPCWPLWKPLQFLKGVCPKNEPNIENDETEIEDDVVLNIRQCNVRTDRPHRKSRDLQKSYKKTKCKQVIDDLLLAVKPLVSKPYSAQRYWFFGRHVTETLNCMRRIDAEGACQDIMNLLNECQQDETVRNDDHKIEFDNISPLDLDIGLSGTSDKK